MNKKNNFRQYMTDVLDVPAELSMNLPRMVLSGDRSVHIENHKGILVLADDYIKVAYYGGLLEIRGQNLELPTLRSDELGIRGKIFSINFISQP